MTRTLDDEESDEDEETLAPGDSIRHYWILNTDDIKFQARHRQTYLHLTGEQLEDRFGCISIAIWTYWMKKSRKKRRISYARVQSYLETFGIEGVYSECLWQSLTDDEHRT